MIYKYKAFGSSGFLCGLQIPLKFVFTGNPGPEDSDVCDRRRVHFRVRSPSIHVLVCVRKRDVQVPRDLYYLAVLSAGCRTVWLL